MKSAPLPLWIIAGSYIALELFTLVMAPSATVVVRTMISAVLFYFLLRGSRVAGYILAACFAGGAIVALYAVFTLPPAASTVMAVLGVVSLALASYLLFSPAVRTFQANVAGQSPPAV